MLGLCLLVLDEAPVKLRFSKVVNTNLPWYGINCAMKKGSLIVT